MRAIKAVFWDSDNTLIDTASLHWAKHLHTLENYGIALDAKYRRRVHENNGGQNWEWMTGELGLSTPKDRYLQEIDAWFAAHANEMKLRDGVAEALDYFEDKNIPQCVVTNGRRSSVSISHQATEISGYFDFVLYKEDYEGRKPDPAPYLTAYHKMTKTIDCHYTECLAIEDDPLGVESAKRAGMVTIYRPTDLVDPNSPFADYTIRTDNDFLPFIRHLVTNL